MVQEHITADPQGPLLLLFHTLAQRSVPGLSPRCVFFLRQHAGRERVGVVGAKTCAYKHLHQENNWERRDSANSQRESIGALGWVGQSSLPVCSLSPTFPHNKDPQLVIKWATLCSHSGRQSKQEHMHPEPNQTTSGPQRVRGQEAYLPRKPHEQPSRGAAAMSSRTRCLEKKKSSVSIGSHQNSMCF